MDIQLSLTAIRQEVHWSQSSTDLRMKSYVPSTKISSLFSSVS